MTCTNTNLVINDNIHEYTQYVASKNKIIELNRLKETVALLSTDVADIKGMLLQILEKVK